MIRSLVVLIFLGSCANIPISYKDAPIAIYRTIAGYPDMVINSEIYNSYEYSFAEVKIGRSQPILMVLASIDNDIYTWIDQEGVRLITRNGRIIQTSGLPNDVYIKQSNQRFMFNEGTFYETVDFYKPKLINADLLSVTSYEEEEDYLFVDNVIKARVFKEVISIKDIGWKEENTYYFDKKNRELKTIQNIHPFLDKIQIKFFYK